MGWMNDTFAGISRSLGRSTSPAAVPSPPAIDEAFARLVPADADLASLFATNAAAAKLHVHAADLATVRDQIVAHLKAAGHRTAVVTRAPLFDRIGLLEAIRAAGIESHYWDDSTLDGIYDVDV